LVLEKQLQNITNRSYFDVYNDKQLVYMLISYLNYIIDHARLLELKFVFFNMGGNSDPGHSDKFKKFIEYYLLDYPEYLAVTGSFNFSQPGIVSGKKNTAPSGINRSNTILQGSLTLSSGSFSGLNDDT
jgi:hypothetical protein